MKKPETERKWILCPHCRKKYGIMNDVAECRGVFLKCIRGCRKEFELVIVDGEQVMNP